MQMGASAITSTQPDVLELKNSLVQASATPRFSPPEYKFRFVAGSGQMT
jgi:hypothetical protein